MSKQIENFGRNVLFMPKQVFQPESVDELLAMMGKHNKKRFRAVGRLHSWSRVTECSDVLIDMSRFDSVEVQETKTSVIVGGGCQVKRALQILQENGLTLPAIGLIDEQTVAGATATGTHGSGRHSLSNYIQAVTIAHFDSTTGDPVLKTIESGQDLLAARCSLGLLGIIVSLTFECRPRYNVQEHSQAHESLTSVLECEYQFPLQQFYLMPWSWKYFGHHRVETVAPRSRLAWLYRWYCFLVIDLGLHIAIYGLTKLLHSRPLVRFFYRRILPLTIIRKWKVVDDSWSMLVMQHELFRHIEIEVFVRRDDLESALDLVIDVIQVFGRPDGCISIDSKVSAKSRSELESIGRWDELLTYTGRYGHHYPICVRRILADDTLVSMACPYGRFPGGQGSRRDIQQGNEDWYAISFISYERPDQRDGFFCFANFVGTIVAQLFDGRCHWGKYNPLEIDNNNRIYPQLDAFREIVERFDPQGHFLNESLSEKLGLHPFE